MELFTILGKMQPMNERAFGYVVFRLAGLITMPALETSAGDWQSFADHSTRCSQRWSERGNLGWHGVRRVCVLRSK